MKINTKYLKKRFFLLILAFSILTSSCNFDLFEESDIILPYVEISNIETVNGKTIISCMVDHNGGSEIEYFGLCFSLFGEPEITENQFLYNIHNNEPKIVFPNLPVGYSFYFKAFAANNEFYSESSVYKYLVPSSY